MLASLNFEPARSASKKLAEKRFTPLKLQFRSTDCWKATPFRSLPVQSVSSRFTPRVIAMTRPDWSVDAPPPAIFAAPFWTWPLASTACAPRARPSASASARRAEGFLRAPERCDVPGPQGRREGEGREQDARLHWCSLPPERRPRERWPKPALRPELSEMWPKPAPRLRCD